MASRDTVFANEELYHIYNRGVEKRDIFVDSYDTKRFLESMVEFNTIDPVGSLFEIARASKNKTPNKFSGKAAKKEVLVHIIAYCLNPNHFHLILEQVADNGVSKFMHKLCGGYSWFFNYKYTRKGSLFQGKFKAKHIDSNEYLLHLSAYVNLNNRVHKISGKAAKKILSSWNEYMGNGASVCNKKIILDQFDNSKDYEKFAISSLQDMLEKKEEDKELELLLLEVEE